MRQVVAVLSVVAVVGILAAVTFAAMASPQTQTAAPVIARLATPIPETALGYPIPPTRPMVIKGYPGPTHTPNGGGHPAALAYPMPAAVPVRPVTATPLPVTPTWGPLPTILPTVIPTNLARPRSYPTGVPRGNATITDGWAGWSLVNKVDALPYVIRARIARIDPPFWDTDDGKRPAIVQWFDVASPALLNVEEVYKGPPLTTIEVGIQGYCFTPIDCTPLIYDFTWSDVIGYDLILFVNEQQQVPGRPVFPTRAYAVETYIVNPDPTKDEVMLVNYSGPIYQSRSMLESDIRAAPSANHR